MLLFFLYFYFSEAEIGDYHPKYSADQYINDLQLVPNQVHVDDVLVVFLRYSMYYYHCFWYLSDS